MDDRYGPYLTVEEAARLLRIGRTKAYAMAREWRGTGGRSGLPVVDLGDVLRVPMAALERLVEAAVTAPPPTTKPLTSTRRHHPRQRPQTQLDLFTNPNTSNPNQPTTP